MNPVEFLFQRMDIGIYSAWYIFRRYVKKVIIYVLGSRMEAGLCVLRKCQGKLPSVYITIST